MSCLDGYMNIALEQMEEHANGRITNRYGDAFMLCEFSHSCINHRTAITLEHTHAHAAELVAGARSELVDVEAVTLGRTMGWDVANAAAPLLCRLKTPAWDAEGDGTQKEIEFSASKLRLTVIFANPTPPDMDKVPSEIHELIGAARLEYVHIVLHDESLDENDGSNPLSREVSNATHARIEWSRANSFLLTLSRSASTIRSVAFTVSEGYPYLWTAVEQKDSAALEWKLEEEPSLTETAIHRQEK
ncbi:uncharacterized protein BXZ73DRAFT_101344 [Epithele typhae]|uniref:uncharacterized protein n=1 Tax=Epithele typhae TaxID=378194 RepID=UPI0020089BFB|nr:uncharacterized protein BXZ73DRAFT_101344 [Epithele typhae]KAH9932810.1 hypothetical protein BXZ73DRAFT_101344 [Epithele typhae]